MILDKEEIIKNEYKCDCFMMIYLFFMSFLFLDEKKMFKQKNTNRKYTILVTMYEFNKGKISRRG